MRTHAPAALLTTALACSVFAAPAQATAPRTFLSAAGSDSNNCTNVATPCRHLAAAYAATAANGEIYVLDPANYGSLTITGPVSIEGHGWASIAPVSGGNAITINANPGDNINIIGVVLDGTALTNTTGIQFNSGGSLNVRDSVIRNFPVAGILFAPTVSGALFVSNTLVSDSGYGIRVLPTGSSATATASISRSQLQNNATGFSLDATFTSTTAQYAVNATITDTVVTNNSNMGAVAISNTEVIPIAYLSISNSPITYNGVGVYAGPPGTLTHVTIDRTTITGNTTSLFVCGSCGLIGYTTSVIEFNGTDAYPKTTGTLH